MSGRITDVPGVAVGHWTDPQGATGCTAVLLPPGSTGARALVGAAPATRETDVLRPPNLVEEVHAFVLSGGSAFGLACADGVVAVLEERGVGYARFGPPVPIVPAASLYDLGVGDPRARPGPPQGRAAALAASEDVEEGSVGAGTGATVGKWAGPALATKGGIGTAALRAGEVVVGAIVATNAVGDVVDEGGAVLAGARTDGPAPWAPAVPPGTVLAVVATNACLGKAAAAHAARMAAGGIARAVRPAHTLYDGDVVFLAATNAVQAEVSLVGALGAEAVAEAVRRSVRLARGVGGVPGLADGR